MSKTLHFKSNSILLNSTFEPTDCQVHQPFRLLTCSKTQDRSIIIWEPEGGADTGSGIWLEVARLGEVGGNMEGYYGCQFSPDGMQVIGCSYQASVSRVVYISCHFSGIFN